MTKPFDPEKTIDYIKSILADLKLLRSTALKDEKHHHIHRNLSFERFYNGESFAYSQSFTLLELYFSYFISDKLNISAHVYELPLSELDELIKISITNQKKAELIEYCNTSSFWRGAECGYKRFRSYLVSLSGHLKNNTKKL